MSQNDEKVMTILIAALFNGIAMVRESRPNPTIAIEEAKKFVQAAKEQDLWPDNIR